MLLQLAWRNIVAHKKHSIVTLLLISASTALLIFSSSWMTGSHQLLLKNAVEIYPGYIQISDRDYPVNHSMDNLIFDAHAVEQQLDTNPQVAVYGARFESFVLFSSGDRSVGGMLTGIEPGKESRLSRLAASLQRGSYLSAADTNQIYIGSQLAKRLHVNIGDQVAFVGSGADYSFAADMLRVKGIFQTGLFEFDANSAFINKKYFERIMAAENCATEIVVLPRDPQRAQLVAKLISDALGTHVDPHYQALSWQQSMSSLVKAMQLDSMFGYITISVIFVVIFFVVMIYTLLSVFARIHQLGIMRAIGTTPRQLLSLLLLEGAMLALISVIVGGCIGAALALYFQYHPIVISGMEEQFKQYGLAVSAMPTAFMPLMIVRDMLLMFVLTLLSTLYPIVKINRIPAVEAIHHV